MKKLSERKNTFLIGLFCILVPQLAGGIGSLFTFSEIPTWYKHLIAPSFAPPNAVFGLVWTLLFLFMGIALFLVQRSRGNTKEKRNAYIVFGLQLVLNVFWSIIFFHFHALGAAFIEIIALWIAILSTIILFKKISPAAAWLLVPYLLWVSFASVLSYSFWMLN